eukprot:SAG11_NODE_511_length_8847_cov_3.611911_8_plen_54_part_00
MWSCAAERLLQYKIVAYKGPLETKGVTRKGEAIALPRVEKVIIVRGHLFCLSV